MSWLTLMLAVAVGTWVGWWLNVFTGATVRVARARYHRWRMIRGLPDLERQLLATYEVKRTELVAYLKTNDVEAGIIKEELEKFDAQVQRDIAQKLSSIRTRLGVAE